jgi:type I restriction enzyme R subunit
MLHNDQTIGGMVVCDSSDQAREMQSQFEEKFRASQEMSSALILHDAGTKDDRKDYVEDFKEGKIDILFVFNMLLTGFDAPRLKKLYMGRVVREHNLLQALTRVNRPYKDFKFGYIVDFADIRKEFEATNAAYFAELRDELGDDFSNYSNLFISREEIEETVNQIRSDLFIYNLENAEEFSKQISAIKDKKIMRSIIASLDSGRNLYNLIRLMNFEDLMQVLDFKKINILLNEATNHLNLLNLRDKVENAEETKLLLNSALEDVIFMFRKDGEEELRIGEMKGRIRQVREALERNIDEKDPEFLTLIDELRRILSKGNIDESSIADIDGDILALDKLLQKAKELNHKNSLLAAKYEGDVKFARLHKDIGSSNNELNDLQIFSLLDKLRRELNEVVQMNNNVLNNRGYFEATIERSLAIMFDENPVFEKCLNLEKLKLTVAGEYFREYEGAVA